MDRAQAHRALRAVTRLLACAEAGNPLGSRDLGALAQCLHAREDAYRLGALPRSGLLPESGHYDLTICTLTDIREDLRLEIRRQNLMRKRVN